MIYLPLWLAHQEREDAEAEPFLTSRGELLAGDEEIIQMPLSLPNVNPFPPFLFRLGGVNLRSVCSFFTFTLFDWCWNGSD